MRLVLQSLTFFVLVLVAIAAITTAQTVEFDHLPDPATAAGKRPKATEEQLAGASDLAEILEPIRREYKLPALAAAELKDGHVVALGAVGVRRAGENEPVQLHDRFHIGSCTKSMTATLCAILVHQGKLKWTSTIGEVFADQAEKFHPDCRPITLEQLLTHRSGLPDDRAPDSILMLSIRSLSGSLLEQRRALVELVLKHKPRAAPGSKHQYSNFGYTIAGAMCERVTDKSWEDLLREHLFRPLGMTTAGFGPPGNAEAIDEPWGHLAVGSIWNPISPGEFADNPAVLGPAGTVHCSLADWAKYAAFHLRGAQGKEPSLPAEIFQKLHTPLSNDEEKYAFGWVAIERGWAGGKALTHGGSNTLWFAVIWLAPNKNAAYLAATNVAHEKAFLACDAAISKLILE
jgi:CubicO group peptidase (beta-lactamase class C family)